MVDDRASRVDPAATGYGNPPKATRFRKGQSGNPAGKPKGARNKPRPQSERLRSLMLEEAYRPIKVSDNGEEATMPMAQAVFRSLAAAAAKGEARAQAMFLKMVSASEAEAAAIEEMMEETRWAEAEYEEPVFEVRIIDAKDGRPTGKEEIYHHSDDDRDV
ncbi:DUF5681 domain-containing protein [Taklimakanibacter lacteus]|uniref:DUF5681 domain-containing protein n=1 Tax=Taklimakanibacter lacteus TaxID=2268456 RepID=UPI0013C40DA1